MSLLFLMQAATLEAPAIAFDLRDLAPAPGCRPAAGDEIVVCAAPDRTLRHRLAPLPETPAQPLLPKAEFGIVGDLKGAIENEAVALPGGVSSNRIMLRMKLPF